MYARPGPKNDEALLVFAPSAEARVCEERFQRPQRPQTQGWLRCYSQPEVRRCQRDHTQTMLLRQALSRTRPALRRVRSITHREEGRKLPREMVAAMTADGDASSYYWSREHARSRVAASGATRAASSAAGDDYVALADEALDNIWRRPTS